MYGVLLIISILLILLFFRFYVVYSKVIENRKEEGYSGNHKKGSVKTLVVLGSGGHTTEIIRLVESLGIHYSPICYVMAISDKMSEEKVVSSTKKRSGSSKDTTFCIKKVPRSREVKQSWLTTVITTMYASLHSFPIVFRYMPDLILCNGPGTCIPICIAGFILKVFGIKDTKIVYVESVCRVETLSMSAKILYYFADNLIVQWPQLQKKYPLTTYLGRVV